MRDRECRARPDQAHALFARRGPKKRRSLCQRAARSFGFPVKSDRRRAADVRGRRAGRGKKSYVPGFLSGVMASVVTNAAEEGRTSESFCWTFRRTDVSFRTPASPDLSPPPSQESES